MSGKYSCHRKGKYRERKAVDHETVNCKPVEVVIGEILNQTVKILLI